MTKEGEAWRDSGSSNAALATSLFLSGLNCKRFQRGARSFGKQEASMVFREWKVLPNGRFFDEICVVFSVFQIG